MTTTEPLQCDFLVIGAGTAGCALAARLSEDPGNRVVLIEAGGARDRHPFVQIPALVGAAIGTPGLGWGLETVPQPQLDNRRIPLPRGRVLGGSGSINGMAYYRGHARDFDDWAAAGNAGWSYAELLPYFLRAEANTDFAGSPFHAADGAMPIAFVPDTNPMNAAFLSAMERLGYAHCPDFNVAEPEGYGYRQAAIRRGRRVSTASAYLRPAMSRPNLRVLTDAPVSRLLLADGRVTGAAAVHGGEEVQIQAVTTTVCAGAYHSPDLLQRSGIGDPAWLHEAGIPVRHALPGVGRGLQDHLAAAIVVDAPQARASYGISTGAMPRNIWSVLRYASDGRGQLGSNLFETTAYVRSRDGLDRPDIQIVFQPARRNRNRFPLPLGHGYAINIVALYPEARGEVRARSVDPASPPAIDPHLGAAADIDTLVRGLKVARAILVDEAFRRYRGHERSPGADVQTDADLAAHVRATATTVHHPGGTCRMGVDEESVVGPDLRVRGLEGLYVADASIFPRLIGGNTNAGVVAVAEKAADLMRGRAAPPALDTNRS